MTERVSAQTLETETKKTFMFSKHQFKIGVIYFMKTKKLLSMALAVGMSGCMVIGCGSKGSGASDDLIVYHAARWMGAGWSRSVRFGYVDFDEDGRLKILKKSHRVSRRFRYMVQISLRFPVMWNCAGIRKRRMPPE